MKHQPLQSITSLPPSPEEERRARMIKYTIMMGIRVVCIFALLFAQGWWILVFAAGAIFLPYFAVVVANVATNKPAQDVERPGGIVPIGQPGAWSSTESTAAPTPGEDDAGEQGAGEPGDGDRSAEDRPEADR
ncbi:DUF3099 domain-containing protein [Agromyces sp. NPDC056523]|uniref:DUF3099 domain-containing protein n=1 Tax=Agromyces sp. NPDC056523 TaxID=3345850 RepID=UPI0036709BF9